MTALRLALAAPVLLVGGLVVAESRQPPGYDPVRQTASALAGGAATDAWVMIVTLGALGVLYVALAAALRGVPRAGRVLLGVGGAAMTVAALAPQPTAGSSAVHLGAAGLAWVGFVLWPLASVSAPGTPRRTRRLAFGVVGVLLVLLGWFCAELWTDGARLGLTQRVLLVALTAWPVWTASMSLAREPARPSASAAIRRGTPWSCGRRRRCCRRSCA